MLRKIYSQIDGKTFGKVFSLKMRLFTEIVSLLLMIAPVVTAQTTLPPPTLTPPINGPIAVQTTTATEASTPLKTTEQSNNPQDSHQAVVKIEESSLTFTPENEVAKKIIVSKVYDAQESAGNSYVLRLDGSNQAVVIDPGYNYEAIIKYLKQMNVNVEAILLTNGYFARIAGNEPLRKEWSKATILIGEKDATLLTDTKANGSEKYGGVTSPNANVWLKDDDAFTLAGIPFHILATPGHTAGSMSYAVATDQNAIVFTGDFVYKDGMSSAALPTSNEDDLNKSLESFLKIQYAETVILPGYGANTTVAAFYEQLTGKSVSVLKNSDTSVEKQSPVIIIERDPDVLPIQTTIVTAPPIAYTTTEVIVENYHRPWLSVGVALPVWSSWYRPWHYYHDHFYADVLPPIFFSPYYQRPSFYGGYYPPLVVPSRPGYVIPPPNFRPPMWGPPRPDRPDFGRPPIGVIRPNDQAGMNLERPPIRPFPSRPDAGAGRPSAGRPDATRPTPSRPDVGRPSSGQPGVARPTPPATRPTPSRPDMGRPSSRRPENNLSGNNQSYSGRPGGSTRQAVSTPQQSAASTRMPTIARSYSPSTRSDSSSRPSVRPQASSTQSIAAASSSASENRRSSGRASGSSRGNSRSENRKQTAATSNE
ncbi:MAG: MBL fold metallo-hydrolase [Planctomycetaceae bacterium]|jgi:glyoxylase-like metal-dependent hydrolase (beta-lactamase superfamily II)|nr:MBL fold metallo-hydrolase [Planctomycetaceae bacterium]